MPTTELPTTFDVGALADKIAEASLTIRMHPPGPNRDILAARLAGLQEAWILMTRPADEIAAIKEAYQGTEGDYLAARAVARAAVVSVEDQTVLIAGLAAGGESWVIRREES